MISELDINGSSSVQPAVICSFLVGRGPSFLALAKFLLV